MATAIKRRRFVESSSDESAGLFRTMANCAPVLLWLADRDKLCTFFNEPWLAFTGRSLEQEFGNGWAQGVHPDDMDRCLETYHSAFDEHRPFEMEYRLRRHDGEYRWVLDRGAPRFASNGEFVGYAGSAVDITEHKQAQERSQRLAHLERQFADGLSKVLDNTPFRLASRAEEFHLRALPEPYVNLSIHTAPDVRPVLHPTALPHPQGSSRSRLARGLG